jgi:hypothetical protein
LNAQRPCRTTGDFHSGEIKWHLAFWPLIVELEPVVSNGKNEWFWALLYRVLVSTNKMASFDNLFIPLSSLQMGWIVSFAVREV